MEGIPRTSHDSHKRKWPLSHRSGFQKRKRKELADLQKSASGTKKISDIFTVSNTPRAKDNTSGSNQDNIHSDAPTNIVDQSDSTEILEPVCDNISLPPSDSNISEEFRNTSDISVDICVENREQFEVEVHEHFHLSHEEEQRNNTEKEDQSISNVLNADLGMFIAPIGSEDVAVKIAFLENHPIQPSPTETMLPFDCSKVYKRQLPNGDSFPRGWISYSTTTKCIYCSVCMAFSSFRESPFISGFQLGKKHHLVSAVTKHEISSSHKTAVIALQTAKRGHDVFSLLNVQLAALHKKQVQERRLVLRRLIDIVVFIGRQGLAYRGKDESAYQLEDRVTNHGNFLELVLLIAEYDIILKKHVETSIELSKERKVKLCKKGSGSSTGRGSLVTFLSKTFINKLIVVIAKVFQQRIKARVASSGIFSIQVDSTQDIAVLEQFCLVLRYTFEGQAYESLIKMVTTHKTTGNDIFEIIRTELDSLGLSIKKIVGCSFDGAANMKGKYNGVQALLKEVNPHLVYTHCLAHILNLVIRDATLCCSSAENLFGLIEETAVFISTSYKRMYVWSNVNKKMYTAQNKLRKLQKIGETRWWSKHKALSAILQKIEGADGQETYDVPKFCILIDCLYEIGNSSDFDSKTKSSARALCDNWLKFENILTAALYLEIFFYSTPTSNYLQSTALDYLSAWKMVKTLKENIETLSGKFEVLYERVKAFSSYVNNKFQEDNIIAEMESDFPVKRISTKKRFYDEKSLDERRSVAENPPHLYKIETYQAICERTHMCINEKFTPIESLMKDCRCLDPSNFKDIKYNGIPQGSLSVLARNSGIDKNLLRQELKQFALHYHDYFETRSADISMEFEIIEEDDYALIEDKDNDLTAAAQDLEADKEASEAPYHHQCKSGCPSCAFRLLYHLNMNESTYSNLYCAYKYLQTLPCTQVQCERVFSKLKIIKTRLRSLIGQELLESLMLINVEYHPLSESECNNIITEMAQSSSVLKKLLL